jgi:FixJ family two-component response regulator
MLNALCYRTRISSRKAKQARITSHADDVAREQALEAGAVAFLYKPCREEELLDAIDAALNQS